MSFQLKYKIPAFATGMLLTVVAAAQEGGEATPKPESEGGAIWAMVALALFLVALILGVLVQAGSLTEEKAAPAFSFKAWWASLDEKFFTRAIPVEKEADFLLDHDYDGIRELDNSLPPWWKYGFYATLVIAVFYILRFHVWKTGPDPEQEYNTEMRLAAAQIEAYRKKSNNMVDEKTVTMADAAGIATGKQLFAKSCFVCHGGSGEGGVGPNLTDDYWLHGGSINDVFRTIKYGVPDKGMQAWEKTLSPSEIRYITSYIKTLKGTKPANAKAPQGDLYAEPMAAVVKDTVSAK